MTSLIVKGGKPDEKVAGGKEKGGYRDGPEEPSENRRTFARLVPALGEAVRAVIDSLPVGSAFLANYFLAGHAYCAAHPVRMIITKTLFNSYNQLDLR